MSIDPNDSGDPRLVWRDQLLCDLIPHAVHRLGNLLTVVMGSAEMLVAGEANPQRREELEQMSAHSRRAVSLVHALGGHARTRAAPPVAVDLVETLRALTELLSPVAKSVGMPLELGAPAGITVARVDPGGLQLLLVGLLVEGLRLDLGILGRDGQVVLRVVEAGRHVHVLLRLNAMDSAPLEPFSLSSKAQYLAAQIGARLRFRGLASRKGLVISIALPALS